MSLKVASRPALALRAKKVFAAGDSMKNLPECGIIFALSPTKTRISGEMRCAKTKAQGLQK